MEDRQQRDTWLVSLISIIFIIGIFAVSSLFLVNIGVQVYKNVVTANNDNFQLRTSLSYVATCIRKADGEGMVYLEDRDGLTVLVLEEKYGEQYFQTLIYYKDGWLFEHFMAKDGYFEPGYGMNTFEIAGFTMEQAESGQLHMTARNNAGDTEELYIGLRSGRTVTE